MLSKKTAILHFVCDFTFIEEVLHGILNLACKTSLLTTKKHSRLKSLNILLENTKQTRGTLRR